MEKAEQCGGEVRDRQTNYEVVEKTSGRVVIRDLGPWDKYMTVTNAAEEVVNELVAVRTLIQGDRLFYFDSSGELDEIVIERLRFAGFKAGNWRRAAGK